MFEKIAAIISFAALIFLPEMSQAAGLVECAGVDCGTCELVRTTNSVINILITIMTTVASLMFVYAGFLLVTSGGDTSKYERAKSLFTNVLIGFAIMLCAWLIVDTVLKSLLEDEGGNMGYTSFGVWNEIPASACSQQKTLADGATTEFFDSWAALDHIQLIQEYNPVNPLPTVMPSPGGHCPLGYAIDAFGSCQQETVIPDAFGSCPEHYTLSADGTKCDPPTGSFPPTAGGSCPSGYTHNAFGDCEFSTGLTVSEAACAPLSVITDPAARQMETGTKLIWTNTDPRLRTCVQKKGGSPTSAYRPQAYQNHLREVHNKWCAQGLQSNTDPACASVKSAVQREMSHHGLSCSRPVAVNSNHTSGRAVDISGAPRNNSHCLTWFGSGDPVHYTLQAGCSCN